MQKKIKIIHSTPAHDNKFDAMRQSLFREYENDFVGSLSEAKNIADYDVVIVHYLRQSDAKYLAGHKLSAPVIWFCFGADLFKLGKFRNSFLLKKTRKLRSKIAFQQSFFIGIKNLIKDYAPSILDKTSDCQLTIKAFQNIDYMVPVVPGDYRLLQENYPSKIKGFHLNLVNSYIEEENYQEIDGKNILLGNSSSLTNNHLEAIDWLSEKNIEGRKVIIPVNYGNPKLAIEIEKYAIAKLGEENVVVLKEFLPIDRYSKLVRSCEIGIMNHLRQQAVGNIIQLLFNGAHLYLQETSPVYQFLKEKGFVVSAINSSNSLYGLNKEQIKKNREKTKEFFGAERQRLRLKELIDKAIR